MRQPITHELKIAPEPFEAVVTDKKRFEIRRNDRDFQVDDWLRLLEFSNGEYTGNTAGQRIRYITDFEQKDGFVVLGI